MKVPMNKKKKLAWETIFVLGIIVLIVPYIANIVCSVPAADDFWMLTDYDYSRNILENAVAKADGMWFTAGGEWLGYFVQILLNPLLIAGYAGHTVGVEISILFIMYVISIIMCVFYIEAELFGVQDKKVYMVTVLCVLAMMLNTGIYPEIYTWFIGSTYMLDVTLSLICVILIIRYYKTDKLSYAIALSVVGFFSSMSIMTVSMICLAYICIFFPTLVKKNRKMRIAIPFLFCLAGGIIAVIAPGNFTRHSASGDSTLHWGRAVADAVYINGIYGYRMIKNFMCLSFLFIIFLVSYYYARKHIDTIIYINPIISIMLMELTMLLITFPVTLGYSSAEIPNRIQFMVNTFLVFGYSLCTVNLGLWLGNKYTEPVDGRICRVTVMIILFVIYYGFSRDGFLGSLPYTQQIVYYSDSVECHNNWIDIFKEIDSSQESDVEIRRDDYSCCNNIKNPGLGFVKEGWVNSSIADYFNKKSVVIITKNK